MRLSWRYLGAACVLFGVELLIACFAHDRFVRPFVGDVLTVPLLYCALAGVFRLRALPLATGVLAFAFVVETLQAFDYVALLHLEHHPWLSIAMGRTFQPGDFVAYTVGWLLVLGIERVRSPAIASSVA